MRPIRHLKNTFRTADSVPQIKCRRHSQICGQQAAAEARAREKKVRFFNISVAMSIVECSICKCFQ
jgi:hypothetical protein